MIETGLTIESCFLDPTESEVRCGDLLLTFQETHARIPGRYSHANWKTNFAADGWQLQHNHPGSVWKGYPFSVGDAQEWNFVLLGELYGVDQENLSSTIHSVLSGRRSAEVLNGHFLLLAYDQEKHRWHVFTDRFGTFHAYYGSDGRRCALGTFSPAVISTASRKQLDWPSLRTFFAQGFFPGDRTFFCDVQILRPASHYVFDAAGRIVERKRYWQWRHEPNRNRTYDDTVDEFAERFEEVMRDHLRADRLALPISGGLDSRSTAATAAFSNVWAYSYGYTADSPELDIARRVAQARNLPFQAFTIKPYLFTKLDSILDSVEGFQDITQCRQAAIVNELLPNADHVIAAHWGDVWLDTTGLETNNAGEADVVNHTLKKLNKEGREWLLKNINPNQEDSTDERMRELVAAEISKLDHIECPDFRIKAFKTDKWSFRWTASSLRMFQAAVFPRLPFYDTRLTDFFSTVPSNFLRGRRLQIDYLKRYAPDLARITWQGHEANLFDYQKKSKVLPKRIVKKAWRTLRQTKPVERNWEVQLLSTEGRQGLEATLMKTRLRIHEFVSPQKIRDLLDRFYVDPYSEKRGYTVSMLLTLSAFLERHG